jgi:hypothetical protein
LKALSEERRDRCRDAIYRYIDLSNEEIFLYNKRRITEDAWIEWRKGIETNMKLPAFAEIWAEVNEKVQRVSKNSWHWRSNALPLRQSRK